MKLLTVFRKSLSIMVIRLKYHLIFTLKVVGLTVLCCSCNSRPDYVVSDEKMVKVMADMEIAEAYIQTQSGSREEEIRKSLTEGILVKNKLSQSEFDSTMVWYAHHSDKYQELYTKVEKELKRRQASNSGIKNSDDKLQDLWAYGRMALFSEKSIPVLSFNIESSEVEKGDRLKFKMRMQRPLNLNSVLGVIYDDGVTSYISNNYSNLRQLDMSFQTDTSKIVKQIFGHIAIERAEDLPVWADSISLQKMPLDTNEYYMVNRQKIFYRPKSKEKSIVMDSVTEDRPLLNNVSMEKPTKPMLGKPSLSTTVK